MALRATRIDKSQWRSVASPLSVVLYRQPLVCWLDQGSSVGIANAGATRGAIAGAAGGDRLWAGWRRSGAIGSTSPWAIPTASGSAIAARPSRHIAPNRSRRGQRSHATPGPRARLERSTEQAHVGQSVSRCCARSHRSTHHGGLQQQRQDDGAQQQQARLPPWRFHSSWRWRHAATALRAVVAVPHEPRCQPVLVCIARVNSAVLSVSSH